MSNIFISYRRSDSPDVTGRIYDRLVSRYSRNRVFKDVNSIAPGAPFSQYIQGTIRQSAIELVIIGPSWLNTRNNIGGRRLDDPTDFVRIEIESALRERIAVIPVLVGGASLPPVYQLPPSLQPLISASALPVRPDPDFDNDMDRLISAIEYWMKQPRLKTQPLPPASGPQGVGFNVPIAPGYAGGVITPAPTMAGGLPMIQQSGDSSMAGWVYVIGIVPFIGWLIQLILFFTAKNRLTKFHAAQATIISVISTIASIAYEVVYSLTIAMESTTNQANQSSISFQSLAMEGISLTVFGAIEVVFFIFWILGMVAGFDRKPNKLPLISALAAKMSGGPL